MKDLFTSVRVGSPVGVGRLTCFPVFGAPKDRFYLSLREALGQGLVRVGEVSEEGRVPEIVVENRGKKPVLLLDGQELVGAKQNRILNISILVPAEARLRVPVSCVESGRWATRSQGFEAAPHAYYASGHAKAMRAVSSALHRTGRAVADQGEIWNDIAAKSVSLRAYSPSGAVDAVFAAAAPMLRDLHNTVPYLDGQVGGVFAVDGFVTGLELMESATLCRELWSTILASFGVDAADLSYKAPAVYSSPTDLMTALEASQASRFPGVGLGESVRLRGAALDGGALVYEQRVLHFKAFAGDRAAR